MHALQIKLFNLYVFYYKILKIYIHNYHAFLQNSYPHRISIFQIHHIDYPGHGFTKLKYNDALTPIIQRGQSHFDLYTDFTSTCLYPIIFHHYIEIQIVWHQCIMSCSRVTMVISGLRDTYAYTFHELLLTVEHSAGESLVQ